MPLVVADRVKDTTTTTGTGDITLAGAPPAGRRSFASVLATNDLCYYCIASDGGSEWEVGIGKLTASTTLARQTILASSNAGAAVSFSAGTKDVFLTAPAAQIGGKFGLDDRAAFDALNGAPLAYDVEFDGSGATLPSGWAWVNQGTSTYREELGAGIITPQNASGDNVRMITRSLSGFPSTWTVTTKLSYVGLDSGNVMAGLVLRESGSGKFLSWVGINERAVESWRWNGPTSAASAFVGNQSIYGLTNREFYLRIKKNSSSSYDFLVSSDGRVWRTVATAQDPSAFLTPDEIGIMVGCSNNSSSEMACHWFRVR